MLQIFYYCQVRSLFCTILKGYWLMNLSLLMSTDLYYFWVYPLKFTFHGSSWGHCIKCLFCHKTRFMCLRWRVTVRLINIHKNVFMHCAKYEHARALWRPSMKTLNTVLSLLSYIQRWVLRNSATAGTIGEIVNCKTAHHFSRAL